MPSASRLQPITAHRLRLLCCHSYGYMIDNVVMLITGALKQRDVAELLPRCHPLGAFDQMAAVGIARTPAELYTTILVDTPLGRAMICLQSLREDKILDPQWGNVQHYSSDVEDSNHQKHNLIPSVSLK